jgi:hypothetical protein
LRAVFVRTEREFSLLENEATTQFESQSDVTLYVFTGEQVPAVSSAADCEARGRDRCERTLFPFLVRVERFLMMKKTILYAKTDWQGEMDKKPQTEPRGFSLF